MPKHPNNVSPKKNRTEERLRATPFETTTELDQEKKAIRLAVWRRFTEAQMINELLTKPDNAFIVEELQAGLLATTESRPMERIFRVFSDGRGIKLELNKEYTRALGDQEIRFVESAVRAGIQGFGYLYLQVKGLVAEKVPEQPVVPKAEP